MDEDKVLKMKRFHNDLAIVMRNDDWNGMIYVLYKRILSGKGVETLGGTVTADGTGIMKDDVAHCIIGFLKTLYSKMPLLTMEAMAIFKHMVETGKYMDSDVHDFEQGT